MFFIFFHEGYLMNLAAEGVTGSGHANINAAQANTQTANSGMNNPNSK